MHDSEGDGSRWPQGWVDSWPQGNGNPAPETPGASPAPPADDEIWFADEPTVPPRNPAGPGGAGQNWAGQNRADQNRADQSWTAQSWHREPPLASATWGDGFGDGGYGDPGEGSGGGRRKGRKRWLIYGAVGVLAAGIGAAVTVALDSHGPGTASPRVSSSEVPGPHNNAAGSSTASAPLSRAAVQAKVAPGLVDITATLTYDSETAEGTGMVLSPNGLVLTNNHVIDGATQVSVTLADPKSGAQTYAAKILGYDINDDVALLQLVGASGLRTVSTGNSGQVKVGTPVLALGNADGKGGAKSTAGVINALDRTIQANDQASESTENLKHMLQTTAVIQQGDSGGALANNAGQVIGMITAAVSSSSKQGGAAGSSAGFAIPINFALSIAQQIASGTTSTNVYIGMPGFLGVQLASSGSSSPGQQRADQIAVGAAQSSGTGCENSGQTTTVPTRIAPAGAGALVLGVLCQTAATQLGLEPGDVITSVNGLPVTTPASLTQATARDQATDSVTITWTGPDGSQHNKSVQMGYGPAR